MDSVAGKAFFSARKHAILFASADATVEAMAMIEIGSNFLKERRSERVREGTEPGRERQTHERTATQAHPKAGTPTPPEMKLGREGGRQEGEKASFSRYSRMITAILSQHLRESRTRHQLWGS